MDDSFNPSEYISKLRENLEKNRNEYINQNKRFGGLENSSLDYIKDQYLSRLSIAEQEKVSVSMEVSESRMSSFINPYSVRTYKIKFNKNKEN
jgi:hypothetical protein